MSQTTQVRHSSNQEDKRYFNVYAKGLGYLNKVRVMGDEQRSRLAAQISVLQGSSENVEYIYHDLLVTTEEARKVIADHQDVIEDEDANVLIQFKMTNPRPKPFIYQHGDRAGELGASMGGFLTSILSLRVNGHLVYEDKQDDGAESSDQENAVVDSET